MSSMSNFVVKVDGTAVTTTAGNGWSGHGPGGSTKSRTGVVRRAGTVTATPSNFVSKGLGDTLTQIQAGGSTVVDSSGFTGTENTITAKALSAGTFAYQAVQNWVMRRMTSTLSGVSNTSLRSGGSDNGRRKSIHQVQAMRYSDLLTFSWTQGADGLIVITDTLTDANRALSSDAQNSVATNPASQTNDIAANPSRTYPGQLVYKGPAYTVKLDVYKPKTS